MYFTRLSLKPQAAGRSLARALLRDSYRGHQALWRLFDEDPEAKRDFLYRQIFEGGSLKYYVLSSRRPHDRAGVWNIEGPREYSPQLQKGQRLRFMLRANPVVFSSPAGRKRHDVVMNEKKIIGCKKMPFSQRPPLQKLVQESCAKWLGKRAASGGFSFKAGEIIAEGYRQHKSLRAKGRAPVCYSSVDFQGILTVSDPESFRHILMRGIGKSKAFGCGLMLIKRA